MRSIMIAVILAMSTMCFAQGIDLSGLTPAQVAQLHAQAAQMKDKQSVEKVVEYANFGQIVGQALNSCAKELNITVNEFAATPVGQLTVGLIVWKVIGREILHFAVGGTFLIIFTIIWIWVYRKMCIYNKINYLDGKIAMIEYQDSRNGSIQGQRGIMAVVIFLIIGISQLIMWCP